MKDTLPQLDLFKPLAALVLIVAVIGSLVLLFSSLNYQRGEKIYQAYEAETQGYIQRNRAGLNELFNVIFPYKEPTLRSSVYFEPNPKYSTTDYIAKLLTQDLKDYSSTAFLKANGGVIYLIDLAGNITTVSSYPAEKNKDLLSLLTGTVDKIPWDDYLWQFRGKEIIIPVKDDSGQVIGAIARGVIE